jgi:hypothetical protein
VAHRAWAAVLMILFLLCAPASAAVARELPWPPRLFKIASSRSFSDPIQDVAETTDGRLLFSTGGSGTRRGGEVRELGADGRLRTIARFPREGGISGIGLLPGSAGGVLVADGFGNRLLRLSRSGASSIIAGTGTAGFSGDGGAATEAAFNFGNANAVGLTRARDGSIVFTDVWNNRIRRIAGDGIITTIAGTGPEFTSAAWTQCPPLSGNGGPATQATLCLPADVLAAADGSLLVSDSEHWLIRRIDASGTITTVGRDIPKPTSLAQLPNGDVLFGSYTRIGRLPARGGRYRPFLTFERFIDGEDSFMVDFGGRGLGTAVPVSGLTVTREGGVLFATVDAYYLAPRRTSHTLIGIRNARVGSKSASLAVLATRAGRVTVEVRLDGRLVARTRRRVSPGRRWLSVTGDFAAQPYEVRVRAHSSDGGAARDAIVLYLGDRLRLSHTRALAQQELDDDSSLVGCDRVTARRVDCWNNPSRCNYVVAFMLRHSGHVYRRSYRCTNADHPVRRHPNWTGPPSRAYLGGLAGTR